MEGDPLVQPTSPIETSVTYWKYPQGIPTFTNHSPPTQL